MAYAHEPKVGNPTISAGSGISIGCGAGDLLGQAWRPWYFQGSDEMTADATFDVYRGGSKKIYSEDSSSHDNVSLGIMIDPSGPADPIIYVDPNPQDGEVYVHCFGYKVRKWKWVSTYEGTITIHGDDLPWQVRPLPRMGF